MIHDLINGLFELIGSGMAWLNIRAYAKTRKVEGVYWPTTAFFGVWGLWNLIYYSNLDQWFSFAGGALLAGANIVWVLWVMLDLHLIKHFGKEAL